MTWIVEDTKTGMIEAEFDDEQDAWEHLMRFAVNGNPYADRLDVSYVDEGIDDLLAET